MRLRGVIGNRRVDVDGVDVRVRQHVVVVVYRLSILKCVADLVQLVRVALADGVHFGVRDALIDRNELGAEAEPTMARLIFFALMWITEGA